MATNTPSSQPDEKEDANLWSDLTTTPQLKSRGASKEQILSIALYCFASIAMTLINKFVVSGKDFSMNFLMLAIQASMCILCVMLFNATSVVSLRAFNVHEAIAWSPVSLCLVLFLYTGSKSIQLLPIPIVAIFKNLTIVLIAYGEVIFLKGRVTSLCFISFMLMVTSSFIAYWSDEASHLDSSPAELESTSVAPVPKAMHFGYLWMAANCVISAAYVLTMRSKIKSTGFSDWDTMFYNQLLATPLLIILSLMLEDWSSNSLALNFPESTRTYLLLAIVSSGAGAVGISFATAWCIRVTSSTTYSMVGALNKLPVAVSGIIFYHDPATPGSLGAIAVAFGAGVLYALAKDRQKKDEAEKDSAAVAYVPLLLSDEDSNSRE